MLMKPLEFWDRAIQLDLRNTYAIEVWFGDLCESLSKEDTFLFHESFLNTSVVYLRHEAEPCHSWKYSYWSSGWSKPNAGYEISTGWWYAGVFRFQCRLTKEYLASPSVKEEERRVKWMWYLHDREEVAEFARAVKRLRTQ